MRHRPSSESSWSSSQALCPAIPSPSPPGLSEGTPPPPRPAQVTREEPPTSCELLSDYLAAAAAPNGVRANSEFRVATRATPATPVPHCPPRHVQPPVPGANFSTVSRETRAAGVPSRGAGAGGKRAPPGSVPARSGFGGWIRILSGGLGIGPPAASATLSLLKRAGAPPLLGLLPPAAPRAAPPSGGPNTGDSSSALGAVSLGPDLGPLHETRRRLPAELPSALPVKGWCEPGAPPRPPSSPRDPGDARAKEGVALRVSSSQRLRSLVPRPLSHPPGPLPTTSVPRSGQSPLHWKNIHETA